MSTSGAPLLSPVIRITAVTVSADAESAKRVNRLASAKLQVNDQLYALSHLPDGGLFYGFSNPITLSLESHVSLRYKTSCFRKKAIQESDIQRLFASAFHDPHTQDLSVVLDGIRVTFTRESTQTTSSLLTHSSMENLVPIAPAILDDCPRFRILVIGKSGVGKSSLIKAAFGIEIASSTDLERGKADISEGLVSPANERFILHDSVGFESGDRGNYDTVKNFIQSRQNVPLRDRIHAVWFCIELPHAGGRLLEAAAEDFFRSKWQIMGTIPLIVVFTKFDTCVDTLTTQLVVSGSDVGDITEEARLQAQRMVPQRHDEITRLAGPLPFAAVSIDVDYRHTLRDLIDLTDQEVGKSHPVEAQIVTRMAQHIDRRLKIEAYITIGKQRYWKALRTSPHLTRHTIWDCLSVIHADIIMAWNFNDPARRLLDKEFKELVITLVQEMETKPIQDTTKILTFGGSSLVTITPVLVVAVSNPAAPIVLPVVFSLVTAVWLYQVYRNVKNVQQIFMAFIVDLTFIMETLFILSALDHARLTRRTIKLAYSLYHDSDVKNKVHARIREYRDVDGRDSALEMIKSLILPEGGDGLDAQDYYARVRQVDVQQLDLDQEEDWGLDAR